MRALLKYMTSRTEPVFRVTLPSIESLPHSILPGVIGSSPAAGAIPITDYHGGFSYSYRSSSAK